MLGQVHVGLHQGVAAACKHFSMAHGHAAPAQLCALSQKHHPHALPCGTMRRSWASPLCTSSCAPPAATAPRPPVPVPSPPCVPWPALASRLAALVSAHGEVHSIQTADSWRGHSPGWAFSAVPSQQRDQWGLDERARGCSFCCCKGAPCVPGDQCTME